MKALLASLTLMLAATGVAAAATKDVRFRTLAHSDGSSSSITKKTAVVIRTSKSYRSYWDRLHSGVQPAPPAPKVDFSRNMVILVTQGQQSSGGHDLSIMRIRDSGKRITVTASEISPGDGCMTTQQLTAPFHLVRVKMSSDRARFVREPHVRPCGPI